MIEQAKVHPELRAVMRRVRDHHAPDEIRPRCLEHGVATDPQRPRRLRVIPRHLLQLAFELPTYLVEHLEATGVVSHVGLPRSPEPSVSSCVSISIPNPGSWATWVASWPSVLDFRAGASRPGRRGRARACVASWPIRRRDPQIAARPGTPSRSGMRMVR